MDQERTSDIKISKEEFIALGHKLVNEIAALLSRLPDMPVTTGETPARINDLMPDDTFPENGSSPAELLSEAGSLLMDHSLFNGHPKFMGYITSSPAPIGILGELLASSINPNVGANILSPVATEIEKQTIRWLCDFIGVKNNYGGILVSGGNMANFTAFLAARQTMARGNLKEDGMASCARMTVYCSKATHTWIDKAMILFGHGTKALRWIETNDQNQINLALLESAIIKDLEQGLEPFMVIGTAGDVSTGVVDDLAGLAKVCRQYELWFHVDGAYGVPAAIVPEYKEIFNGLTEADSIAIDPHKWLYAPLEAGCTLVRNPKHLLNTFSSHPEYYNFTQTGDEPAHNFYEFGLQNSRGFRALKVWLALRQVGRSGFEQLIREDILLAAYMYELASKHPRLQAMSHNLSITTFRYIPPGNATESYINEVNKVLLNQLQLGGKAFLSNAVIGGKYCLRGCIVNFRTTKRDIDEILAIIDSTGMQVDKELRISNPALR
ncbi:pyridoxal phosphate-dependent decarboxylase family protein [Fulvivirga sedimenti]|uniref:Aminotransferase class V-fold PLP-dependent enzyme n=1 Tax=Fulvivirga sedimenti TaxID=2879465 RepID=A0A9X1L0P1_9BACT|nr:aminotransferase class V-fold PLP-dependent enzyme [Fulvivirga sedimenti]MCA6075142.1 aminotransferase class V-fold PLP-dependent enzyme [Fulvivirga sedimenti]MCA6076319.1 aminotransferase class V-fold PLP-dependent enzyme [Fulvivirga sedimenti]MCA6077447.1 aminotransferase class V-fold PLP-dependent enzyme [Fulvivirga sedimenti]